MHFNLALILVVITLIAGLITLYDKLFLERARKERLGTSLMDRKQRKEMLRAAEPVVVEYAKSFFPILLGVLIIRSFVYEPFRIPSASMVPTLYIGDLILVNKFVYGVRLPVTNTKITEGSDPERGDVIVFRYPDDERINYIKRVVGIPGDRISLRNNELMINGKPVSYDVIGVFTGTREQVGYTHRLESLPDGGSHELLLSPNLNDGSPNMAERVVPEGHYFVLGDNRDHSKDGRIWGFVPEDNLVGRASVIWMRLSTSDWDRIGTVIE